jgi:hypothetical protein
LRIPIPQSVASNAEARAKLRAQGLDEREIGIGDSVDAVTAVDGGYWFGQYTMLDLPPLRTAGEPTQRTFAVPDVIHTIVRLSERLLIGTEGGPYLLSEDKVTRLVWK